MLPVLKRISLQKLKNEKGKSGCIILAIFLTTILFIVIFSTVFFVKDALDEMSRNSSSWTGDAAFIATDEEEQAIKNSSLVADCTYGLHIGEIKDTGGYIQIELVCYQEKMAHWMKCYPTIGRMPKKENEIVVSEQYLAEHNMVYEANKSITITYTTDEAERTEEFVLVGTYDKDTQTKNVMLLSEEYYDKVGELLQSKGKDSRSILYKLVEVIYHSSADVTATTTQLIEEVNFNEDNGYTVNDSMNVGESFGTSAYVILAVFILFVMMIGYLFISNIFSISMNQDVKFYGKLSTNGVTEKEIRQMIILENHILFIIAIVPALVVGYIFTSLTLPGILSSFFTFQVENRTNIFIFLFAIVFSYMTLVISFRKPIKVAQKISPMGMKRYVNKLKEIKKSDDKSCLNKFVMRKFKNDKRNAAKIYISIAVSILLANMFYSIVVGFDEKEYISTNMATDYSITDTTFYSQTDDRERQNISLDLLSDCNALPGLIAEGGGAKCGINIVMNEAQTKEYDEIIGDSNLNDTEPGNMYTYLYGLDNIMVEKMKVLEGTIDVEAYNSGKYVIVDSLGEEGSTCFHVGDSIVVSFQSEVEKTYVVMAVAELPYEISFRSKWMGSSDIFLPYEEWSSNTGLDGYYMYTYDVEEVYQKQWDATLASVISKNSNLTYQSAKTMAEDNQTLMNEIKTVGFVLSAILFCMGIMNFINCMTNSVYSRKRELAIMESMGTTKREIISLLVKEGVLYMAGGILLGCVISGPCIYLAVEGFLILYSVHYGIYPFIYILFAGIGLLTVILVPLISYLNMDYKESFLVRIRSSKE